MKIHLQRLSLGFFLNCAVAMLSGKNLSQDSKTNLSVNELNLDYSESNFDLVKWHSLSLRSPTLGSLAADILNTPPNNLNAQRDVTRNLLDEVCGLS